MVGRLLVLVVLASLAGCSQGTGTEPPEGHWVLREMTYDGTTYDELLAGLEPHPVTLLVEDGSIGGRGACNDYGATPESDGRFPLVAVEQTAMGCVGGGREAFDKEYFAALTEVTGVQRTDDGLVLTGEDLRMEFRTGQ